MNKEIIQLLNDIRNHGLSDNGSEREINSIYDRIDRAIGMDHDAVFGKSLCVTREQEYKPKRDREYRDKRLMVAVQLFAHDQTMYTPAMALNEADKIMRANQKMKVPE